MGSYHGHCRHCFDSLIQSEAAIACLPNVLEHLWGKNVPTRLFPNWVMFSALQTGTSCPVPPGRNAHLLWDAMPNFCGTQCPIWEGRNAHLLWDAMPSLRGTPCPCVLFSTDKTSGKLVNVDISPSNSIPLLKRENHLSVTMPNIFLLMSHKETCPGKGIPVVAPSVVTFSALSSSSRPYLEILLQTFFLSLLDFPLTSRKKFRRCGYSLPLLFFLSCLFFSSY